MNEIRQRGLKRLVLGLVLSAGAALLLWGIYGALSATGGHVVLPALIGLPFVLSVIGLFELVTGIRFQEVANKWEELDWRLQLLFGGLILLLVGVVLFLVFREYW